MEPYCRAPRDRRMTAQRTRHYAVVWFASNANAFMHQLAGMAIADGCKTSHEVLELNKVI